LKTAFLRLESAPSGLRDAKDDNARRLHHPDVLIEAVCWGVFVVIGCSFLYLMTPKRKLSQQHGAEWVFTENPFSRTLNERGSVRPNSKSLLGFREFSQ
jgi:hypothetical protein